LPFVHGTADPIRYGTRSSQVADLWRPPHVEDKSLPVVVLVHGGFWRAHYTKALMNGLARSVVSHGWIAWNIEYRRVGIFGGGGGWPETFVDVADAIDRLARIDGVDTDRVVTVGHSAGGQLALWAGARHRLPGDVHGASVRIRPAAAVALAGLVDLTEADRLGLGGDATAKFLGGHSRDLEEVYSLASPAGLLPIGTPQLLVHGLMDSTVPPSMSSDYAERASRCGDQARFIGLEGVGHRDVINPAGRAWKETIAELERLFA
jgi:acetyl esterase/lipase